MASRYWVGGTATWDGTTTANWSASSGGAGGASVPTAADDVFLDAASGAVTVTMQTATALCRSLTCTGFTGTLANINGLNIGDASGGALTMSSTMTLSNTNVPFTFVSTSNNGGAGWPIITAGKTMPSLTFNGAGGRWVLQDALTVGLGSTPSITLTAGTLDTNNQTVTSGSMVTSGTSTKVLTLGSSSITLTGSSASVWSMSGSNITLTATSSTITLTGAAASFAGSSFAYGTVVLSGVSGSANIGGNNTYVNFTLSGSAAKTNIVTIGGTATITGTFTIGGSTTQGINRLLVSSGAVGTQRTITATGAAVVINGDVDFMDIDITGSPSWTNAGSAYVGDCGGNGTLITTNRTTPATQTRSGAGGNWSSAQWTSRVPLPQDNVVVNGSASGTIAADMPRLGADIDFTGFAGTFICSTASLVSSVFGSFTLSSGMTFGQFANSASLLFAGRGSHTITSAGQGFSFPAGAPALRIDAVTGSYQLQDAFSAGWATTSVLGRFELTSGTLDSNGQTVSVTRFFSSNTNVRSLILGTSTWNLTGPITNTPFYVWDVRTTTNLTLSAASSTIVLSAASTSQRNFSGTGLTYGTLRYNVANSPALLVIDGGITFAGNPPLDIGPGRTVTFKSGNTTTVTNAAPSFAGQANGYLYLPGVAGHYASTPDSAALSITGDIDIRVRAALNNWTNPTTPTFITKYGTNQHSYEFFMSNTSLLKLALYNTVTGTAVTATCSAATGFADGSLHWVRATWRQSDGRVQFWSSDDGSIWTQIGTNQTIAIASIADSTAPLEIGSEAGGSGTLATGQFYRAQIRNNVLDDGTGIVFDADFTTHNAGSNNWLNAAKTQFAEGSANAATVTINGALAQVGDGRVVLNSSTPDTQSTLSKPSGIVSCSYLSIQDSKATGGASWHALSSANVSNNSGWIFASPPNTNTNFMLFEGND